MRAFLLGGDELRFNFFKNLLAKFRGNDEKRIITEVLSDSRAVFSSFGNDIYFSDFVNGLSYFQSKS